MIKKSFDRIILILSRIYLAIFGRNKLFDKRISILLCIFLGIFGAHKFYERRIGMGFLYLFTLGFFGIGVIADLFTLLAQPTKYYI